MKAHAVAKRSKPARSARAQPAAGKRARAADSAHERQAAGSAARFLCGESGLGASLTPAVAARWVLPGSVPRALPSGLRASLEQAYDADLSGLQLHDDAPAHASARAFGARAFTAGSAIYFAQGAWAPGSAAGRELLAHEVAHAIQQTGRASHLGRRRLEPSAAGEAGVQRETDPNADSWVGFLADETAALQALNKRHAAAPGADQSLSALIALVTAESGGKLARGQDSAIGKRLVQIAEDDGFEITDATGTPQSVALTTASLGYLVDALKVCGEEKHFEAAAKLIDADTDFQLRSSFGPRTAFRKYLEAKRGEDWVAKALRHPSLARFWPGVFFNVFEQYVFNPGRPRQSLYGFKDARDEALKNIDATTEELLAGDRVVLAFELLDAFDQRRLAMMKTLDGVLEKKGVDLTKPMQRLKATGFLAEWLQGQLKGAGSETWRAAIERMRATAADAAGYWERVSALVSSTFDAVDALGGAMTAGLSTKMKHAALTDARFDPLKKLLQGLAQAGGLYGLNAAGELTDLPANAAGYEARLMALARALGLAPTNPAGNQLLVLQTELIAQYHGSKELDSELAVGLGFTIWWLLEFQPALMSYQAAKDSDAKRGFTDRRMVHRVETASQVLRFAQAVGWADVLADASRVVRGDDVPASYLLVRGSWGIDEGAELSQMADDFGSTPLFDQYPFTADNVARFFHADMLRQMSDAVMAQVDRVYSDPKAKLEAEEVNKAIRAAGRPWRVLPESPLFIFKPSQIDPVNGKQNAKMPSAFSLIKASPKSLDDLKQIATAKQLGNPWYYSALREKPMPMFAWLFPDIGRLIQHLRPVAPFDSLVPGGDKLDAQAWMLAVVKAMDSEQLKKALTRHVSEYSEAEQAGLEAVLREYTTVMRRERRETIAGWLKRYAGDRTVVNFELPGKSVKAIDWFQVEARPEADASPQLGLLVLSLGDELEAAFPTVRNAARIPPLFHYTLVQAVNFADDELAKAESGDKTYRDALRPLLFRNPYTAVTPPKGANPKLQVPDEEFKHFLVHRGQLQALADRMETAHLEMQESSGFYSGDGRSLQTLGYYPKLEPGRNNAIEVDGDEWELVEVRQKFTYHPPLKSSAVTDKSAKPILKDGKGNVLPIDNRVLATFLVNGVEYELHADETAKLVAFSNALFWFGFSRSMEDLAEGLEAGAMFMMDVIELIPGVGQELMVARLTAQTAAFIGGELPTIAEALKKDPVDFIKKLAVDLMDKYLTLDGFINFVMLGAPSPLDVLRKPTPDKQSTSRKPHGKLGRLLAMLRKLGMRVADAMQWLQLRVSGPVRSLQSSIATRPKLGWVLRKAIDIALWARDVIPPGMLADPADKRKRVLAVIEQLLPGENALPEGGTDEDAEAFGRGLLARIEAEVKQSGTEFKEQFEQRLQLLAELQLPGEVIPLEKVVAYVIDFFLSRLGAKVRIAKALLEPTKPYQDLMGAVSGALADQARGTAVDPNEYWRKYVLDSVEERFVDARNQLVQTIYGLTDRVADETGVQAFRLEQPAKKSKADMGIQRLPFPHEEVELSPDESGVRGEVPVRGRLGELPTTAGQPLAVRVRRAQEAQFGHDFRHVRVHSGEASKRALTQMHADAATAGSHVFVRPGLDTERGEGARLLRHELTHVLQQAGARPLGGRHTTQPLKGRPGVGLKIDEMREAAADAMARADGQVAREPVEVMEGAEGVQPSLQDVAVDMLQMFTEIHSAGELEGAPDPKDKAGPAAAHQLLQAVRHRLNEKRNGDFLPFAFPVATHIAKHVSDVDMQADLPKVAARAQKPAKGARGKKPRTVLDFGRLVTLMEGLIFFRTGIAMQIKATEGNPLKIDSLSVTYIHLGWILPGMPGKAPLWDTALANSPKLVGADDPKLVRLELYQRLKAMGPDPFIWKTGDSHYRFSDDFAESFGKLRVTRKPDLVKNLPPKGTLPTDPKDIPKFKNEYLNPTGQSGIGLRIGLHGGHTGLEKQAGMDRESHHTVQYLLVQFFRNDNSIKAWRTGVTYKGLKRGAGAAIESYQGATAGALDLQSLDRGGPGKRGSGMPAILIAADTHRRGQLHVEKESQWKGDIGDPDSSDSQGRATQGLAIRGEFQRNQVKRVGLHDDAPGWSAAMQRPNSQDQLHQAMVDTYHWMYGRMMGQLQSALLTRELAYYRAVAARIPGALDPATGKMVSKYDLQDTELTTVFNRVKSHTNDVMSSAGWPTP